MSLQYITSLSLPSGKSQGFTRGYLPCLCPPGRDKDLKEITSLQLINSHISFPLVTLTTYLLTLTAHLQEINTTLLKNIFYPQHQPQP